MWNSRVNDLSLMSHKLEDLQAKTKTLAKEVDIEYRNSSEYTEDGEQMTVDFDGMNFTLSDDLTLTVQDNDCTRTVSLQPPTHDELITGSGYRSGSMLCKSWFAPNRENHREVDEVKEYYEESEP
ncbi:unnamed protein product [Trichobilharzia regenti]|nr:unnamed protein product [Trichobilharzia regenti]